MEVIWIDSHPFNVLCDSMLKQNQNIFFFFIFSRKVKSEKKRKKSNGIMQMFRPIKQNNTNVVIDKNVHSQRNNFTFLKQKQKKNWKELCSLIRIIVLFFMYNDSWIKLRKRRIKTGNYIDWTTTSTTMYNNKSLFCCFYFLFCFGRSDYQRDAFFVRGFQSAFHFFFLHYLFYCVWYAFSQ